MQLKKTPLTSAAKSNEKLVKQKSCNTVLILDALPHFPINEGVEMWTRENNYHGVLIIPKFPWSEKQKNRERQCR